MTLPTIYVHIHIVNLNKLQYNEISPDVDGGPLSRICAHLAIRLATHRTKWKFVTHMACGEGGGWES